MTVLNWTREQIRIKQADVIAKIVAFYLILYIWYISQLQARQV